MKKPYYLIFLAFLPVSIFADENVKLVDEKEVMVTIHDPFIEHRIEALELLENEEYNQSVIGINKKVAKVSNGGKAFSTKFEVFSSDIIEKSIDSKREN